MTTISTNPLKHGFRVRPKQITHEMWTHTWTESWLRIRRKLRINTNKQSLMSLSSYQTTGSTQYTHGLTRHKTTNNFQQIFHSLAISRWLLMDYEIMIVKKKRETANRQKKKTDQAEMIMRAVWLEPLMLRTTHIYATTHDPNDNLFTRPNTHTHLLNFNDLLAFDSHDIRFINITKCRKVRYATNLSIPQMLRCWRFIDIKS